MPTTTGLHTVAFLKGGLKAGDLAAAAAVHDLTVETIARFCIEPIGREGVVLGFSGFTPSQIQSSARLLRNVIDGLERGREQTRRRA